MTREQFLNATPFRVKGFSTYKGASTFKYTDECIVEQNRSSRDESIIHTSHHINVSKVGTKSFEGFTFVMNTPVKIKLKFEDLVQFEEEA